MDEDLDLNHVTGNANVLRDMASVVEWSHTILTRLQLVNTVTPAPAPALKFLL